MAVLKPTRVSTEVGVACLSFKVQVCQVRLYVLKVKVSSSLSSPTFVFRDPLVRQPAGMMTYATFLFFTALLETLIRILIE